MPDSEQMTFELPAEVMDAVREAVRQGFYTSADDVVRAALAEWHRKRYHEPDPATLKALIDEGLASMDAGELYEFDVDDIAERGMQRLAARSRSA